MWASLASGRLFHKVEDTTENTHEGAVAVLMQLHGTPSGFAHMSNITSAVDTWGSKALKT